MKVKAKAIYAGFVGTAMVVFVLIAIKDFKSEKIILDGISYSRSEIIEDFINITFSSATWDNYEYSQCENIDISILDAGKEHSQNIERRSIWPYKFMDQQLPKRCVVNKWNRDITIGINWPYNQLSNRAAGNKYSQKLNDIYPVIERQVKEISSDIEKETGLKIKFISPLSSTEKTEGFARVRIIPVFSTGMKNFFKTNRVYPSNVLYPEWILENNEDEFFSLIPFTPKSRSQVDGYILPNEDNIVEFAVCKIHPDVDPQIFKSLINECLLRALGLPNISDINKNALLGGWNASFAPYSKVLFFDGERAELKEDNFKFPKIKYRAIPSKELSQYDRLMIELLYCVDIKPGMEIKQVRKILLNNEACLKAKEGK